MNREALLGTEDEVRDRLKGHLFQPVEGGHQIKTVYLSSDLVVFTLRRRAPLYWNEERAERIQKNPLFRPLYRWAKERNSWWLYYPKQGIKYLIALASRDPAAGSSFAMRTTLKGYQLSRRLGGLVDPFMILDPVEIRTERDPKLVLSPVIVKERCDKTLLEELEELIASGKEDEVRRRLEELLRLEEEILEKQLANLDIGFKNYRLRQGKIVLRDSGHVTDNYQEMMYTIESFHGLHGKVRETCNPLMRNIAHLACFSQKLSEEYRKRALDEVYTPKNLDRHWFKEISHRITSGPTKLMKHNTSFVPILTYHGLVREDAAQNGLYALLEKQFEEQMAYLSEKNFRAVPLKAISDWLSGETLPEKSVVLTFDDGLESDFSIALPILKRHGFTATFFVNPAMLDTKGHLTSSELQQLSGEGMEIGSHGLDHVFLTRLNEEGLRHQMTESKKRLEEILKKEISFFSIPRGRYNRRTLEAIKQSGYRAACTSDIGENCRDADPFRLKRWALKRPYTLDDFISVVEGRPRRQLLLEYFLKQGAYRLLGHALYEKVRCGILKGEKE